MSSECLVCFEKINNNRLDKNIDVWICDYCNVEIHRSCKTQWDIINEENNTCPHCREEERTNVIIIDDNDDGIDNVEFVLFEPIEITNREYYFLYIRILAIIVPGVCCCCFMTGLMYFFLTIYSVGYIDHNYTRLR